MVEPRNVKPIHENLLIGWKGDVGQVGWVVNSYLNERLKAIQIAEIEPASYFPLSGVSVSNNAVNFPETYLFSLPSFSTMTMLSDVPVFNAYRFLETALEKAVEWGVKRVFVVGGMSSMFAHTTSREILANFSSQIFKDKMANFELNRDMDFTSEGNQRPSINSLLIWLAGQRGMNAATLWLPVPFYLAASNDYRGARLILQFYQKALGFEIDLSDIDEALGEQNTKLGGLRNKSSSIDRTLTMLERNLTLADAESAELIMEVDKLLRT